MYKLRETDIFLMLYGEYDLLHLFFFILDQRSGCLMTVKVINASRRSPFYDWKKEIELQYIIYQKERLFSRQDAYAMVGLIHFEVIIK